MKHNTTSIAAIVAILLTSAVLWLTNRAVTPRQATWDDVVAEGQAGGYRIVTTDELAGRLRQEAGLLLVDTRQEWEYQAGHLQGAANFPMEPTAWARWHKTSALEKILGPDKDRPLVFY